MISSGYLLCASHWPLEIFSNKKDNQRLCNSMLKKNNKCLAVYFNKKKCNETGHRAGKSNREWKPCWQEEKAKQNNNKTYSSFCFTFHTSINWILVVYIPFIPHSPSLLPPFLDGSLLSKTLPLMQQPLYTDWTVPSLSSTFGLYLMCPPRKPLRNKMKIICASLLFIISL